MERATSAVNKLASNDTFINFLLMGCFGLLSMKSLHQQNQITALEAEKDSISQTNKAMKKTIWDWKQQLYSEAESQDALVPLSTLRAIYGETTPVLSGGGMQKKAEKSQAPRLLI